MTKLELIEKCEEAQKAGKDAVIAQSEFTEKNIGEAYCPEDGMIGIVVHGGKVWFDVRTILNLNNPNYLLSRKKVAVNARRIAKDRAKMEALARSSR